MKVISVLNSKGGTGKTTVAVHLSQWLTLQGKSVLLIDADPQQSAFGWANSGDDLPAFPVISSPSDKVDREIGRIGGGKDFIVIDGSANTPLITASAIRAADLVLIPVQPSGLDLGPGAQTADMVQERAAITGKPKSLFVLVRIKSGTKIEDEARAALRATGNPLAPMTIADRTAYAKAMSNGKTVFDIRGSETARAEMEALGIEVIKSFETVEETL